MGTHYSPKIVTDGLVLCLDAANLKSYPGTGTVWNDLSGNNNHATLTNSPVISDGVITWDGLTQYATITANQESLDFSSEQTITIWMYHTFTVGRRNPWDQAYGGYGTWTHEQGSNINAYYGDAGANAVPYTALGSASTTRSEWQMMTFTRNTTTVSWYRNGVLTSSGSNSYLDLLTTTANIRIASGYAGYWEGQMGPVLAYKRTLTAEEITQNYNALRGRFGV